MDLMYIVRLIVLLLLLGVIFYLLNMLISKAPVPEEFRVIAKWILLLLGVLYLIAVLLGGAPLPRFFVG